MIGFAIPVKIVITWLLLLLMSVLKLPDFYNGAGKNFDVNDVIFGIIPEQMVAIPPFESSQSQITFVFLIFIIFSVANLVAVLSEALITELEDNVSLASKSRFCTTMTFCLGSFALGSIFIIPNGSQLIQNTISAMEIASAFYLGLIVSTK